MMRWLALLFFLHPAMVLGEGVYAARTLPSGTILQDEDISLDRDDLSEEVLRSMLGQQTRVTIYEGRPISAAHLTAPHIVTRNQIVVLAYETALMRIETEGRALEAGQEGQIIRVMNLTSRTTVSGRVTSDGTVIVQ